MEDTEVTNDTVHPEVRAHINSLVSAVRLDLPFKLRHFVM
jgi:hypothetical protein